MCHLNLEAVSTAQLPQWSESPYLRYTGLLFPHLYSLHCDYSPKAFPVAFVASPTDVDVIHFPRPMDSESLDARCGPVTCLVKLNVASVTLCQS